jgi:hypothetical protein
MEDNMHHRVKVFGILSLLLANPTWAYKIRPYAVTAKNLKQRHQGWLEGISPVHEMLTKMALACAQANPTGAFPCTQEDVKWDNADGEHPLIKGARWNDDPNNLFEGGHPFEWAYWLTDANSKSKAGTLERTNYLTYRSHFFDLQFLHAMSMKGHSPIKVQKDILDWCRFSYDVAVGTIRPDATIISLRTTYGFARIFDGTGPVNWTVRKLFTNVGQDKFNEILEGVSDKELRWRAAGALLHTIQDSFSASHTERENNGDESHPPAGAVRAFLDYSTQNHTCHGQADLEPAWVNRNEGLADGPVSHGAWVLRRVLAQQAWDAEADAKFSSVIFALSPEARRTDGGSCAAQGASKRGM